MKWVVRLACLASAIVAINCNRRPPSPDDAATLRRPNALSSGDYHNDFSRLAHAGFVGVVQSGTADSPNIRIKPIGADAWLDIPSALVSKRTSLKTLTNTDGTRYDQVRLELVGTPEQLAQILGIYGWDELQDYVTLVGVVESNGYSGGIGGDGDWLLQVRPDPGYEYLLVNRGRRRNDNGLVECEVEPPDSNGSEDNEKALFGRLVGKRVVIVGTWAEDKSHDNKTEIHPITSIAALDGPFVHLFAISDDSANFPATVPHSG